PAIAPNGPVADHDAQLEQLASNPLGAPETVLAGHGRDEIPHFEAEMRTSAARARLPAPEQAPAVAMPAHDRSGCDDRYLDAHASRHRSGEPGSRAACPSCAAEHAVVFESDG